MKYLLASEIVDRVMDKTIAQCPDCEFDYPAGAFMQCPDCTHIACPDCLELHCAEPHISDGENSPEAHGAWRYDA